MSDYRFSEVPQANIQRSKFDRSHGYKTAFNSGYLVPFFLDEVIPGDTFDLTTSIVARLSTPFLPVMDNIHVDTFFFYVPTRLVWNNFERFWGAQDNPGDSIDFTEPQLKMDTAVDFGSIYDYLGIPPGIALSPADWPSALPLRACNLIWNEWFRDENLQDSLDVPKGDGPDDLTLYSLQKRNKRHDYFTSALPFPQKGPSVNIPLTGGSAPVFTSETANSLAVSSEHGVRWQIWDNREFPTASGSLNRGPFMVFRDDTTSSATTKQSGPAYLYDGDIGSVDAPPGVKPVNLWADVSNINEVNINFLRQGFAMQRFLESLARSGSRYKEILEGVFNVVSPDARLQRPEFLGGSSEFMNITPVAQTSSSDATSPLGHLAGFGKSESINHGFTKSFVEHGYVIGFINVWVDLTYQQGLRRLWSRRTRWDHFLPQTVNIGEQIVSNREIFLSSDADQNDGVFGYQERYAEYRYFPSMITGLMRSTAPQPLDQWHLAQKFDSLPTLSSKFIEENPPLDRVLAVQNEPQIFLDSWFNLNCTRPMPLYSIPGFGNRF